MDVKLHCSLSKLHLQLQLWESRRTGVSRMQPDCGLTHATGCPCSPPGSGTEYLPQGSTLKQVWFDLTIDLGSTPWLPTDLASFLGDATDEQINSPCPPAFSAKSSPWSCSDGSDQCCAKPMGGTQPKTSTAPSNKPTAASQAGSRCRNVPDPLEHPGEWIQGSNGQDQAAP